LATPFRAAGAEAGLAGPPSTPAFPVVEVLHGLEVADPYRWLEDGADPAVRDWTARQDAHARAFLDRLPGRPAVLARIREALDRGALGGSEARARWRFYTRRPPGAEQAALYASERGGVPRLLVDPGRLGAEVSLACWEPSPDGELVCFGLAEGADERATLRLLRTSTGEWLPDRVPDCRWSAVAFEPGARSFLYTRGPVPGTVPPGEEPYHHHVWRHVLGTHAREDQEVAGQGRDPRDHAADLAVADDGRWAAATFRLGSDRAAVLLRGRDGPFRVVFDEPGARLHVLPAPGGRLLGLTDFRAPNWRLVEVDPERPGPSRWRELVPESEDVIQGFAVAAERILVYRLVEASSRVSVHRPDGGLERWLPLPELCTVTHLGAHPSSPDAFVTVQGFTQPARTFDLLGREVEALEPPPGFEAGRFPARRTWFRSRDGTRVPLFLVGRAEGSGPTVLTGYGGFGRSLTPTWMPAAVPFLEAGGLLAVACLRGGGELGAGWHRAGMLSRKQDVFDDFLAAAEWLQESGWTTPAQLGIVGHSNGGLLVGAALTQRPELFGAAVCRVPLLDMVRYEGFKVARLWSSEYGTAADPEHLRSLLGYSPYHRVRDGVAYPPTLIMVGERDARVDPMHGRKMAARLQAAHPRGTTLLLAEPRGGHGAGRPATRQAAEEADAWAFLMSRLGL
jgi:prolyl oligopeptidase